MAAELADVVDLSGAVAADDNVTGLAPDWEGNVWFATGHGTVGYVGTDRIAHSIALPEGEQVQNSISTSPTGTAVATTHALYQLKRNGDEVVIDWRQPYDRGRPVIRVSSAGEPDRLRHISARRRAAIS